MATLTTIDTLVRVRLPPGCAFERLDTAGPSRDPFTVPLITAERDITKRLVVYEVQGSSLDEISIPKLDPAPLVHNPRLDRLISKFALDLDPGSPARISQVTAGRARCLYTIATFAQDGGFPSVAARLTTAANALGVNSLLGSWTTVEGHDLATTLEERWLVYDYFGLLHEAGHVYAAENPERRFISDADLDGLIEGVCHTNPGLASAKSLEHDHLHGEICADAVCVGWLWDATFAVMKALHHGDANPWRLMLAISSIYGGFTVLNLCRQVAEDCSSDRTLSKQSLDQNALLAGFGVRRRIAENFVLSLVEKHLGGKVIPVAKRALRQLDDRLEQMLTGFDLALPEIYRNNPLGEAPTIGLRVPYVVQAQPKPRRKKFAARLGRSRRRLG